MIKRSPIKWLLFIVLAATGCKEKFQPAVETIQSNLLVVEGYINAKGFTSVTLRRSVPLKDTARLKAETSAQVTIAGEDNTVYNVREKGNGSYVSDSLILNANQKYRLHIKTKAGGEYLSEYVAVKQTPLIDSVNWKLENNGVQIYVNTHDPQNNTRYYKWDYEETWEIHSAYGNYLRYLNGKVIDRDASEISKLFYCWKFQNSTSILLGSSAQLTNDVINLAPVLFIPIESEKLSVRYSVLIKQYALDRKAYDFYRIMKSNTESLGSVFDPLPSELTGNISCVSNSSEKVIGYITAASVIQKRLFIDRSEVPSKYNNFCETTYVTPDSIKYYYETVGLLPYESDGHAPAPVKGYFSSFPDCIDCTLRGSNIKPVFW